MRIRSILALMVAGLLLAAGVASAQSTTTEPLSDYTTTTPTVKTPTTTSESGPATGTAPSSGVAPSTAEGNQGDVAPSVAAQPAAGAPSELAFTGAEPLLLVALGLGVAGAAGALLLRDRRRIGGR